MCVLTDDTIAALASHGLIQPYRVEQVNPASYDMRLGTEIIDLATGYHTELELGDKIPLYHGKAILATTIESVNLPDDVAAWVSLKSSMARSGLDHALAGWIDPGFRGQITLEFSAHREVVLIVGQPIVQLVLYQCNKPASRPYNGKYQGQIGVTAAR